MNEWWSSLLIQLLESNDPWVRGELTLQLGEVVTSETTDIDAIVGLLERAPVRAGDPAAPYVGMLLGLALHTRYRLGGPHVDLAAGISALDASLPRVPVGVPWHCLGAAYLVEGLRLRASGEDGRDETDVNRRNLLARAIKIGERELAQNPDGLELAAPLLAAVSAAYHDRWRLAREPDDMKSAIRCGRLWHAAAGSEADADIDQIELLVSLLLKSSYLLGDLAAAEEAVALLTDGTEPGDVVAAARWRFWLGHSYLVRWELDERSGGLTKALSCVQDSLRLGLDGDWILEAGQLMLRVACHLAIKGVDGHDAAELRRLMEEVRETTRAVGGAPPDAHARVTVMLAFAELVANTNDACPTVPDRAAVDRISGMLAQIDTEGLDPWFRGVAAHLRELVEVWTGEVRAGRIGEDALTLLLAERPNLPSHETKIADEVASMLLDRSRRHGDLRGMAVAARMMRDAAERPGAEDLNALVRTGVIDALNAQLRGDGTAFAAGMERVAELTNSTERSALDPELARTVAALRRLVAPTGIDADELAQLEALPTDVPTSGSALTSRLALLRVTLIYAVHSNDHHTMRDVARNAMSLFSHCSEQTVEQRLLLVEMAAEAESHLAEWNPDDTATIGRAKDRYAEACALAGGPQHPSWAILAIGHARALRRSAGPGDRAVSRKLALSALYGQAWQVILQSGTDYAMQAVRSGADLTRTTAGWCAEDAANEPEALDDLIAALDLGRGHVLRAVTGSQGLVEQLTQAGRPDLAQQWLTNAERTRGTSALDAVPDALRLLILHALHPDGVERSPLVPTVRVKEIREALGEVGADTLVYLVDGFAVVVPVSGGIEIVPLPYLQPEPARAMRKLLAHAPGRRDLTSIATDESSLIDLMCEWAWLVGIQPLLTRMRAPKTARPLRLVLIPTGPYGLIPWHAAFDGTGETRQYALQDVVFSYAVSAERFCASSRHPVRRPRTALIVGDPNNDLPSAAAEANAIQALYPRHTSLPRATPDEVLRWFTARGNGPSCVHFACHGRIDPARPADAELVLNGGNLAVRRLIEDTQHAALRVDQVFLAACNTGVSGDDYDEAVSIATTFLAAGARTVFGSLWAVPDSATSLLMFALHHYLSVDRRTPADALRAAQLWMLDPERKPLPRMPEDLASHLRRLDGADTGSWAAFTHSGR
jgi:hypothetical protein